jgi:hypothetical protein
MRFSTFWLSIPVLTLMPACSSYGGASTGASGGADPSTAGSASGVAGNPGTGGSSASQAGAPSSSGGTPSGAGGSPVVGTAGSTAMGGAGGATQSAGAQVLTWVPSYRISESKQRLSAMYGNLSAADGLSRVALQFWVTNGGSVNLSGVNEADVTWFHDWARQHGVQILLCVTNFVGTDWNWGEAQRSFKDNGPAVAASIVSEIAKRDFDGVDIDFEGIVEPTAEDQTAYTQLAKNLAAALHPLGKVVTIDSFYAQYNAPNWNWWPDLLPVVDGITSMGYEKSGLSADYQALTDHAMPSPEKLTLGVPSTQDTWLGNTVNEQLAWIIKQGQIGVGIWDASFHTAGWQTQDTWAQLKAIKAR